MAGCWAGAGVVPGMLANFVLYLLRLANFVLYLLQLANFVLYLLQLANFVNQWMNSMVYGVFKPPPHI